MKKPTSRKTSILAGMSLIAPVVLSAPIFFTSCSFNSYPLEVEITDFKDKMKINDDFICSIIAKENGRVVDIKKVDFIYSVDNIIRATYSDNEIRIASDEVEKKLVLGMQVTAVDGKQAQVDKQLRVGDALKINVGLIPKRIVKDETIVRSIKATNDGEPVLLSQVSVSSNPTSAFINYEWNRETQEITLVAGSTAENNVELTFSAIDELNQITTKTKQVTIVNEKTPNEIVVSGDTIKLERTINPNAFCWATNETGYPTELTLTKDNGDTYTIPYSDASTIELVEITDWNDEIKVLDGHFLDGCEELDQIDLSFLTDITDTGSRFLYSCKNLEAIDLTPISNITSIGDDFLAFCWSLETVDCSMLTKVTSIGDEFLHGLDYVENIDFSGFDKVTTIGDGFLSHLYSELFNTGITDIDLDVFKNVKSIGDNFLWGCQALTEVDMRKMESLESIGDSFLRLCSDLETLYVPIPKDGNSVPSLYSWGLETINLKNIYCGNRLQDYKATPAWSQKAILMS